MSEEVKVLIGIPYSEKVLPLAAFLAWMRLAAQGHDVIAADGAVPLAREQLVRTFLKSDCTHLLMLDLDHAHPPDVVQRLTRWLGHECKPKIVNGLHYQRKEPFRPAAFMWESVDTLKLLTITSWTPGLVKVDATGAASLLVAREVFEKLGSPYFPFHYIDGPDGPRFIGEDIWFCRRAQLAGYDVWIDTTTTSPHVGERLVGEADFRGWLAAHPPAEPAQQVDTQMAQLQDKREEAQSNG